MSAPKIKVINHYARDARENQRVQIKGGMREFVGKTGTIIGKEGNQYRVRLDSPVNIPGVGYVEDDLWDGNMLKRTADARDAQYAVEFAGQSKRYPMKADTDAELDAAVKRAGLWKKNGDYPDFTIYKDGEEIGGGGGSNSGSMDRAHDRAPRVRVFNHRVKDGYDDETREARQTLVTAAIALEKLMGSATPGVNTAARSASSKVREARDIMHNGG